jgi:hypothetical protein
MANKITKEDLVERLKGSSKEDRTLFREALQEVEPEAGLSVEELLQVREVLGRIKEKGGKKKQTILDAIDEFFGVNG